MLRKTLVSRRTKTHLFLRNLDIAAKTAIAQSVSKTGGSSTSRRIKMPLRLSIRVPRPQANLSPPKHRMSKGGSRQNALSKQRSKENLRRSRGTQILKGRRRPRLKASRWRQRIEIGQPCLRNPQSCWRKRRSRGSQIRARGQGKETRRSKETRGGTRSSRKGRAKTIMDKISMQRETDLRGSSTLRDNKKCTITRRIALSRGRRTCRSPSRTLKHIFRRKRHTTKGCTTLIRHILIFHNIPHFMECCLKQLPFSPRLPSRADKTRLSSNSISSFWQIST